jgi:peptidyl-tRNA hydrolase
MYKTQIVVALGNYTHLQTRHNAGQLAIDYCVENLLGSNKWALDRALGGWIAQGSYKIGKFTRPVTFFKPREYMNLNGVSIKRAGSLS